MNYAMDGPNSMPWHRLEGMPGDIKIELTDLPKRDAFHYNYDLWSNGLSTDAFGIGRTYRTSIRSRSRGKGIWTLNFDTKGRLINATFSGKQWDGMEVPDNGKQVAMQNISYPTKYRMEMHRLLGGTWISAKWLDHHERTGLSYIPTILSEDNPFRKMAMMALNLFVETINQADSSLQDEKTAILLKKIQNLNLLNEKELLNEMNRFHRLAGFKEEIPVEPPDLAFYHYHAIPILVETGCGGPCTFCGLYRRKIIPQKREDVLKQIDNMVEYLGEEVDHFERVVLMEGDALTIELEDLNDYLDYAKKRFSIPIEHFAHCFSKASTVLSLGDDELLLLHQHGLDFVNMGLETGCQELLDQIKPGQRTKDFYQAILKLRKAGINVSVNVIAGIGGKKYFKKHMEETTSFVSRFPGEVQVFFSPLFVPEGCYYEKQQEQWEPLSSGEKELQCKYFHEKMGLNEYLFIPI